MTLLSNRIGDYYFISQGKTRIPGVNDYENLEETDVSPNRCSENKKKTIKSLKMSIHRKSAPHPPLSATFLPPLTLYNHNKDNNFFAHCWAKKLYQPIVAKLWDLWSTMGNLNNKEFFSARINQLHITVLLKPQQTNLKKKPHQMSTLIH